MYIITRITYILFLTVLIFSISLTPTTLSAQEGVLEEIIVTAQRREQSLQEVPVSLEVISGAGLIEQGFNTLTDLAAFSPSAEIRSDAIGYSISIRGMGSTGSALSTEQSATTFIDGIHLGRGSMSHGAYFDLERIEVLRGPQPVHFGMNATAGAFSLTTKKPGPEWQGDISAEYGNFGRVKVEGGIGGPVTDTLSIRVAGKFNRFEGHMIDITTKQNFPYREDYAGRISLRWRPTDAFEANLSANIQTFDSDGSGIALCRSPGDPELDELATLVPGLVPAFDAIKITTEPLPDCVRDGYTRIGHMNGNGVPYRPVPPLSQSDQQFGFIDAIDLLPKYFPEHADLKSAFEMDARNYRLGLIYQFANGIQVETTTGYVDYYRFGAEDSSAAPVLANWANRTETFDMLSQEIRFRSITGGTIEWEAGAFYQTEDLDGNPSCEMRPGLRRPLPCNYPWQDAEWKNVFGSVTFNFMENKTSIDIGARYSQVDKTASVTATGRTWIFDIDPDGPDNDGIVETDNGTRDITAAIIDCATGDPRCGTYGAGYWTHIWGNDRDAGGVRRVPDAWNYQKPVDFGAELMSNRAHESDEGARLFGTYETDSLDPQVTLRYRPNDNMSIYAKWVRAFKSGGFDTASRTIPGDFDSFEYTDESAEAFEVGMKGTLLDNRARYGVSVFRQRIHDLQLETSTPQLGGGSDITQAGLQETKGVEFDFSWAMTDQLTTSIIGAITDGTYIHFPGAGCTDAEYENAEQTPCYNEAESIAEFGDDSWDGKIDRSGYEAPRNPNYKIVGLFDYWQPLFNNYKLIFHTQVAFSDGYITDPERYNTIVAWDDHVDWNINAGFGDRNDRWKLTFYGRNILGARIQYFPEEDVFPVGIEDVGAQNSISSSSFFTYGIQMTYNYN